MLIHLKPYSGGFLGKAKSPRGVPIIPQVSKKTSGPLTHLSRVTYYVIQEANKRKLRGKKVVKQKEVGVKK